MKQFNEKFPSSKNNDEIKVSFKQENYTPEKITTEDFIYERSRGIFFGFLFSIAIIFLLIIVSTETNIFI